MHDANSNADLDVRSASRPVMRGTLRSSLGPIVDLSSSGARVSVRRAPTDSLIALELGDEHERLHLAARVVWVRRLGLFRHEVGLFFPAVGAEAAASLRRLMESHRFPCDYGAAA